MMRNVQADAGPRGRLRHPAWAILLILLPILLLIPLLLTMPRAVAAVPRAGEMLARTPIEAAAIQAPAQTNTLTLEVVSARTEPRAGVTLGDLVTEYEFQIVEDNTGDPFDATDCFAYTDPPTNTIRNPNYPDGCEWPGVRTNPGWAPIVTQGTQDDLPVTLPDGKYLISVLADGYKVDGEHFTVPLPDPGLITVGAQPLPLPPATMRILVFDDNSMTNGQYDAPVEQGLAGFRAVVNDTIGEITNDMFGNPLCTEYEKDANGDVLLDADGMPTIIKLGGECLSDETGSIVIPNLGPLRYDVLVVPPDG
ncbi:MAG: hypothetical protein ACK2UC_00330, partial [Anaerolineae bacterium]